MNDLAVDASALTRRVAEHIAAVTFEDLPPATVRMTKLSLLDGLGVLLAGTGTEPGTIPFAQAAAGKGLDAPGPCTVLGHGLRASAPMAAFANGAAAHALDFEDTHDRALVHPNAAAIPAVLALAESEGPVSGRRLLLALAVGCDLTCRLALALRADPMEAGWYPPTLMGAFGATAAAAKLLHCDADQIADALALTLGQSTFSVNIARDPRSELRAVRDAFPAQTAVLAALLAKGGVHGFTASLEGPAGFFDLYADGRYDPVALVEDLGRTWAGEGLSLKPWPSCRGTHGAVEAAIRLATEPDLDAADIAAVRVRGGSLLRMLFEPEPQRYAPRTAIDARFSLPFCVAVALRRRTIALEDFTTLDDPQDRALVRKVSFDPVTDEAADRNGPVELLVTLHDGTTHRTRVDQPYGSPANPMSDEDVVGKFLDCAARAARPSPSTALDRAAGKLLALETVADVAAELMPDLA